MLATWDTRTLAGATLHAAFCLAFAGFFQDGRSAADRKGEFRQWHMTRALITRNCPHPRRTSLPRLYTKFPASLHVPLFNIEKGFTRQCVTNTLRSTLSELGYKGRYSGHSFRRGAATSASESGLSEDDIMILGRWKSEFVQAIYLERSGHSARSTKINFLSKFRLTVHSIVHDLEPHVSTVAT